MTDKGGAEKVVHLAASAPKPQAEDLDTVYGVPSTLPFGPFVSYTDKNTIYNTGSRLDIAQLIEMRRRDGQVRALMRLITLPIRASLKESEWIAGPQGGDDEAKFMNDMFSLPAQAGGMKITLSQFIRQVCLALVEGFAAFEKERTIPDDGPLKGKITYANLWHLDAKTVKFRVTDKGEFMGLRQIVPNPAFNKPNDILIDGSKSFYYAANEEENPFYGISYFEPAFYHFDAKQKLYYVAHVAAQFAAVPGRIGTFPAGATKGEREAFQKALADVGFNTAMTKPVDYEVDPLPGTTGFNFIDLINHHNNQMSKSVMAGFIDVEQRQSLIADTGNNAEADFFVMQVEAIMDEIGERMSHMLAPELIDWNFGSGKYPVFKFGQVADSTRDIIKELFQNMSVAASINATPQFFRELEERLASRLGLSIDYEKIAQEEQAEKEQFAQQQEQALKDAKAQQDAAAKAAAQPPKTGPDGKPVTPPAGGAKPPFGGGGGAPLLPEKPTPGGPKSPPLARMSASETGGGIITLAQIAEEISRQAAESLAAEYDGGEDVP